MPRKPTQPAVAREVEAAFAAAAARLAPLATGARLLLGCSAGGDSMALLHLAARHASATGWRLAVAHIDHRQRSESSEEAGWVAERASALGLECFVDRIGDDFASASPLTEEVMREARHELLRRRAGEWGASAVALAHQADDRAETFLIRLLAGSGPTGLASIRPVERVAELTLVRPLLGVRREALRGWLTHHGLAWCDDPTNASLATKRGWVRHALVPSIRDHIGLDPTARIVRAAGLIEDEASALNQAAKLMLAAIRLPAEPPAVDRLDLSNPLWKNAGPELRRQLLRTWLWELKGGGHPPGLKAVEEALNFVERGKAGGRLRTIGRWHLTIGRAALDALAPSRESAPET